MGDGLNGRRICVWQAPRGVTVADRLIRIDQNGIEGEGSCTFGKIEQTGPNAFLIYTYCDDDTNGSTRFEIIDGKLVITAFRRLSHEHPRPFPVA